jgi:hypothetical protein
MAEASGQSGDAKRQSTAAVALSWVTEAEALAGRCTDTTRISPTMARVVMIVARERA